LAQADEGTFIAAGVCKELDDMKALYMGLPDFLTQASALHRLPSSMVGTNKWLRL
jgi:hypothetical protein